MKNAGIRTKIFLLMLMPVICIFILSAQKLILLNDTKSHAAGLEKLITLASYSSKLVHELQKERGATSGYLGSKGAKFGDILANQRVETDKKIASLKAFLKGIDLKKTDKEFRAITQSALSMLAKIKEKRSQAQSLNLKLADALGYYTTMNGLFLSMVTEISHETKDPLIVRELIAYDHFLQSKERAGIERAVLSNVFSAGSFRGVDHLYNKFHGLVVMQGSYINAFKAIASPDKLAFFQKKSQEAAVKNAEAIRDIALKGRDAEALNEDPVHWFEAQTKKINVLKEVDDFLGKMLVEAARKIGVDAQSEFNIILLITAIMIGLSLLAAWIINRMTGDLVVKIKAMIHDLSEASHQLLGASEQVSSASQSVADGASDQAANLEETSATIKELDGMTKENAKITKEADQLAGNARNQAIEGSEAMGRMVEAINQIKESSEKTAKIIKTIDEIAFQTNLLALNAAVEAARAGDAGKGFAVVAEEVRNLALRSATAAKDTNVLIEDSNTKADSGAAMASAAEAKFQEFTNTVENVGEMLNSVSDSSSEQTKGIGQVTEGMTRIDEITQANAASAEQTAASSQQLTNSAHALNNIVSRLAKIVGESSQNANMRQTALPGKRETTAHIQLQ